MDGGARENLGVEGLRIYLSLNSPDLPVPRILIISNAGQMLEAKDRPPGKIWRGDALLRSYATTYEEVHNQIFRHYLADRYFPGWPRVMQPVASPARALFGPWATPEADVYVFALTLHPGEAPATGAPDQRGAGNPSCRSLEAIRAAQEVDTLVELDRDTLNQVACVGTWLMERWSPTVRCLLGALRDGLPEPLARCPPTLGMR
jgi:hypothetical protein